MPVNRWIRPAFSKEKAELLAKEYQLPLFLAEILAARGLDSPMRADDLLNRSVPLSDPFCLPDMEAAVSESLQREKAASRWQFTAITTATASVPLRF